MVYAHVNSKGVTLYLNQGLVANHGDSLQPSYFFTMHPGPNTLEDVPDGVFITENPRNGFLAVRTNARHAAPRPTDSARDLSVAVISVDLEEERGLYLLPDAVIDEAGGRSTIEYQYPLHGSSLSRAIAALKSLVRDPEAPERELQILLEEVPELVPGEYLEVRPHVRLESANSTRIPDFAVRPVTGFWDILELKRPRVRLIVTESDGHIRFSAQVKKALQQLRGYAQLLEDPLVRRNLLTNYQIEMYKPRRQLIIGTSSELSRLDLQVARTSQAQDVTVHTWDDVVALGESRLRRWGNIGGG